MIEKHLVGYLSPLSAQAGDVVDIKVSTDLPGTAYEASLVRLVSGDNRRRGTGYAEVPVSADFAGSYIGREQPLIPGSWAALGDLPAGVTGFACWCWPTLPAQSQVVLATPSVSIRLENGSFQVNTAGGALVNPLRAASHRWHRVVCLFDDAGLTLHVEAHGEGPAERARRAETVSGDGHGPGFEAGAWYLATEAAGTGGAFDGRLEAPVVSAGLSLEELVACVGTEGHEGIVAAWDFSCDMAGDTCPDSRGGGNTARFYQQPTRAVKGRTWDGTTQVWTERPDQYAAIHFHKDDIVDAGWETDFRWTVPADLPSGVYAVKLVAGEDEDLMPVFVRPAVNARKQSLALLMSTATYLAYANQRMSITGSEILGDPKPRNPADAWLLEHREVGYSLYEYHADGSGVHFSSWRRPVLNLRPKTLTWSFNADTNLLAWLEAINEPFDVITDEDLHREGEALLADYRCVITGTHPEYYSTAMLDAVSDWLGNGGRLMYMGGNGFYWRIAYHPDDPAIIEVRRAEDGTRAWIAEPGEYYHQFTGEYGGLWRRLGRPPNRLVGVGFAAQGFDGGTHYRLEHGALEPRVAFIMEGVEASEFIGGTGTQGGGAAGEEIDRFDATLGSPEHAVVIASSTDHRPGMLKTKEEYHMMEPPRQGDRSVRADMTFFECPGGGAVFSSSSISYAGSLSPDNYANDVATLTRNVLNRFLDPTPFEMPD